MDSNVIWEQRVDPKLGEDCNIGFSSCGIIEEYVVDGCPIFRV